MDGEFYAEGVLKSVADCADIGYNDATARAANQNFPEGEEKHNGTDT